jgi:hypothetical protein
MSIALWRPDLSPPAAILYPAVLYQERISTITPSLVTFQMKRHPGHDDLNPHLERQLARAASLQKILGDLHVPTSLDVLSETEIPDDEFRSVVSAALDFLRADRAVAELIAVREAMRKEASQSIARVGELDRAAIRLQTVLAEIEQERLAAREDDSDFVRLRESAESLTSEVNATQKLIEPLSRQRRELKSEQEEYRKAKTSDFQIRLKNLDSQLRKLKSKNDPIPNELLLERESLQRSLREIGSEFKSTKTWSRIDAKIDELNQVLVNHLENLSNVQKALDAKVQEINHMFQTRLDEANSELDSITHQLRSFQTSVGKWHPRNYRGDWDFLLTKKVGPRITGILANEFNLPMESFKARDEWVSILWGPKILLEVILEILSDFYVADKSNWFTVGRSRVALGGVGKAHDADELEIAPLLMIGLPVPDPAKFSLEELVKFRRKNEESLNLARNAIEELANKFENPTGTDDDLKDYVGDNISVFTKQMRECLEPVDNALEAHRARILVKAGAIVRKPTIISDQLKRASIPAALTAGVIALNSHDWWSALTLGKGSTQGALLSGLALGIQESKAARHRRSVEKSGLRYLYELGREFDVRYSE